eukprot:scaffold62706_cov48-Cyclotella_meneghiniana.AAC.5
MGYHESTVYRLVNCCFLNDAAIADQSDWDPVLQKSTPRFRNRLDVMRNRNRQYDFKRKSANSSGDATGTPSLGNCAVEMTDAVRNDAGRGRGDGRASVLTDMPGKSVCTDKTDANTLNNERNNQDLAIKLALERRERSEIEASLNAKVEEAMKQIEHFKALAMSYAETSPQMNWTENPELVSEMQKCDNTADAARKEMAEYKKAHMAELEALRKERDELRAQNERDIQELRARKASTPGTGGCDGHDLIGAQEPLQPVLGPGHEEQNARIQQRSSGSGSVAGVSSSASTPFSDRPGISQSAHLPTVRLTDGGGGGGTGGESVLGSLSSLRDRQAQFELSWRGADNPSQQAPSRNPGCGGTNCTSVPAGNVWTSAEPSNNVPLRYGNLGSAVPISQNESAPTGDRGGDCVPANVI